MKGDRIIFRTCGRVFRDIEAIEDSRQNRYRPMCPYCHGSLTTNVEEILEEVKKRGWFYVLNSKKFQRKYNGQLWDVYENYNAIKKYPRKPRTLNTLNNKIYSGGY